MKHISKQPEPQALLDWKSQANADWQPSFEQLRGEQKRAVQQSLMREQGLICCYCKRRLANNDFHIEHFRPQSDPACDALDYRNLLCSCQNKIEKGEPRHCGNLKDNWFDEKLLVSPLSEACATRFAFAADGSIRSAEPADLAATVTIQKLGLAIRKLKAMRQQAIDPFLDPDLTEQELRDFAAGYLRMDAEGKFGEFWTTIHYLFASYGTQ